MNATSFGQWITNLLKGWGFPPIAVGIVRAVLSAAILAGLAALNVQLHMIDWGHFVSASVPITALLGSGWGVADQRIDPTQNDVQTMAAQKDVRASGSP